MGFVENWNSKKIAMYTLGLVPEAAAVDGCVGHN
jgi:hypothetical protein